MALSNRPALLLADRPTGQLNSSTAATIFKMFHSLNRAYGLTVMIVSHDPNIARYVERVVAIRDGKTSSRRGASPGIRAIPRRCPRGGGWPGRRICLRS